MFTARELFDASLSNTGLYRLKDPGVLRDSTAIVLGEAQKQRTVLYVSEGEPPELLNVDAWRDTQWVRADALLVVAFNGHADAPEQQAEAKVEPFPPPATPPTPPSKRIERSIKVKFLPDIVLSRCGRGGAYQVVSARNTTSPAIGDRLSIAEVDVLIVNGTSVEVIGR